MVALSRTMLAVPLALAALTACEYAPNAVPGDTGGGADGNDSDTAREGDTGGSDSDTDAPPAWWSLDGTVVVAGGAVDTAASALTVGFWNDEGELCAQPMTLVASVDAAVPADVPAYGWWTWTLAEGAEPEPPCSFATPPSVTAGIGALDTRLWPAMKQAGIDPETTSLYGLYTSPTADQVWVYGVAGTAGNFDGSETAVTAAPLPDGSYQLVGLHLLPL